MLGTASQRFVELWVPSIYHNIHIDSWTHLSSQANNTRICFAVS